VKNMLTLYSDESGKDDRAEADAMAGCGGWTEEMERRGVLRVAAGLRPHRSSTHGSGHGSLLLSLLHLLRQLTIQSAQVSHRSVPT
jgi:hypothetical protein